MPKTYRCRGSDGKYPCPNSTRRLYWRIETRWQPVGWICEAGHVTMDHGLIPQELTIRHTETVRLPVVYA